MTRAERNRTLTIADEERHLLRDKLLTAETVDAVNYLDKVVLGSVFEVLPKLPDAFADLIVVDPPYNLSRTFGSQTFAARSAGAYADFVASWLPDVCKKLKPHGSLYLCSDWRSTPVLQAALERELSVINRITWQREKGRGATANWKSAAEDILFAVADKQEYTFNVERVMMRRRVRAPYKEDGEPKDWVAATNERPAYRDTFPSNFWDDLCVPFWSMPENTDHPTQKPEKLVAKLVLASSNEGDVVFDPFLGSGTTSAVARKLGRHFCGIELDETYCLLAQKRVDLATRQKRIQGLSDGVFWERNSGV